MGRQHWDEEARALVDWSAEEARAVSVLLEAALEAHVLVSMALSLILHTVLADVYSNA